MKIRYPVLLLFCALLCLSLGESTKDTEHDCEYESPETDWDGEVLNVHVVAHTHDDVGWLKTPDEYYSGLRNNVQHVQIEMILDNVIRELLEDPKKKFTYVEMAFLQKWWREQTDSMKENVKMLVRENRLVFALAGWAMSDEACVYYEDFINNIIAGN